MGRERDISLVKSEQFAFDSGSHVKYVFDYREKMARIETRSISGGCQQFANLFFKCFYEVYTCLLEFF